MPLSMRCAQENLGVRPQTAGFVIPLGTQLNMDGTALYEAAAALIYCQFNGFGFNPNPTVYRLSHCNDCIIRCARDSKCGHGNNDNGVAISWFTCGSDCNFTADRSSMLDTVRTVVNVQGDMMISVVVDRYAKQTEIEPS